MLYADWLRIITATGSFSFCYSEPSLDDLPSAEHDHRAFWKFRKNVRAELYILEGMRAAELWSGLLDRVGLGRCAEAVTNNARIKKLIATYRVL